MPATLEQKKLFAKDTYTIEYNGVRLREQGFNKNAEVFVQFENLSPSRFFRRIFDKNAIILCMFFGVVDVIFVIGLFSDISHGRPVAIEGVIAVIVMTAIGAATLWFSRKEYVGLGDNGGLLLFDSNRPSRQAVEAFMGQVREARAAYLHDVYVKHTEDVPAPEKLRRLIWLKSMEVLSEAEFEAEKRKLDQSETANTGMGFRSQK